MTLRRAMIYFGLLVVIGYATTGWRVYDKKAAVHDALERFKQSVAADCNIDAEDVHLKLQKVEQVGSGLEQVFDVEARLLPPTGTGDLIGTVYTTARVFGYPLNGTDVVGYGATCRED